MAILIGMDEQIIYFSSPVGWIEIVASEEGVHSILFKKEREREEVSGSLALQAKQQLEEYFQKKRQQFDLPLAPKGTEFQQAVWEKLLEIPFGVTSSYGAVAHKLGDHKKTRAVGLANGRNPVVIVIPCHRVIGADGTLTGYGGGLDKKKWLLAHESRQGALF